jgi:hypothetical protein
MSSHPNHTVGLVLVLRAVSCFVLLTVLPGCQYERSTMNVNSDSGIPFLGLQLSVDARDAVLPSGTDSVQQAVVNPAIDAFRDVTLRAQSTDGMHLQRTLD